MTTRQRARRRKRKSKGNRSTPCPKCARLINKSKLEDHLLSMHGRVQPSCYSLKTPPTFKSVKSTPTSAKKPDWLQPRKPPFFSPNKQESGGYKKGRVICPVCHGDGGAAGHCYKCGGLQWVKASASTPSNTTASKKTRMRDWVHPLVRDPDGRFRSEPMYDRYDDESGPEEESDS